MFNELWTAYRRQFEEWLSSEVAEDTAKDYIKALDKLCGRHVIKTISDLSAAFRAEGEKRNLAKAIRKFSKYLFENQVITKDTYELIKARIKLKQTGVREVFITDSEVKKAYLEIKKRGKPAEMLFLIVFYSGIRLRQAVGLLESYNPGNLYVINSKVARYPIFSLTRGKKKGFWAYGPLDLFTNLTRITIKYNTAKDLISYERVSANTLRKWHYTFLLRAGMPSEVADFIQGRVSGKVGATHYLDKTLLADEWYSAVVDDLKKILEDEEG